MNLMRTSLIKMAQAKKNPQKKEQVKRAEKIKKTEKSLLKKIPKSLKISLPHL